MDNIQTLLDKAAITELSASFADAANKNDESVSRPWTKSVKLIIR